MLLFSYLLVLVSTFVIYNDFISMLITVSLFIPPWEWVRSGFKFTLKDDPPSFFKWKGGVVERCNSCFGQANPPSLKYCCKYKDGGAVSSSQGSVRKRKTSPGLESAKNYVPSVPWWQSTVLRLPLSLWTIQVSIPFGLKDRERKKMHQSLWHPKSALLITCPY